MEESKVKTAKQLLDESEMILSKTGEFIIIQLMEEYAQSHITKLEARNKKMEEALSDISEITIIQDNYQEAFEIVQNIVDHVINKTER